MSEKMRNKNLIYLNFSVPETDFVLGILYFRGHEKLKNAKFYKIPALLVVSIRLFVNGKIVGAGN